MSQKTIPYSIEAEEALLGNILVYKDAMQESIEASLVSDDFYIDKNKKIFTVMSSMYENKEKVDTVSLSSKLIDFDYFDKVGGMDYLVQLADKTVSNANTKEYIKIIKNKSIARRIIRAGEEIASDGYSGSKDTDILLDDAEKKILDITRSRTDSGIASSKEVFAEAIKRIEAAEANGSAITGVKSRYADLDNLTAGFQKGALIILAARPGIGKTAFALNIAINSAAVSQGACAIFSLEMSSTELAMRMLAAKAKVDGQHIKKGQLNENEWGKIKEASQELSNQKIFINDTPGITMNDIYAKCRKLKNDHGLYLVIVDYIQLIQSSGHYESRQQEVSDISRKLKALARDLDVPVIALSQLSRDIETRNKKGDARPLLSDLRESGSLEQDADIVMFIHQKNINNDEEHDINSPNQRVDVQIVVAKHRNGPIADINLAFQKDISAFFSISNNKM